MNVTVPIDTATPALEATMKRMTLPELQRRVGPACRLLTETHLAGLGQNKDGWPSTGFYQSFARNVRWVPDPTGVAVAILPAVINGRAVSFAQRRFGGTISPVTAKALAIPISPVSYGKVPSDFPGLFMIKTPKGAYLVQSGEQVSEKTGRMIRPNLKGMGGNNGRRIRATLNFLFKLVGSVTQDPDPSVLPTNAQYSETAVKAILN